MAQIREIAIALAILSLLGPADAKQPRSAAARAEFMRLNPCPAIGQAKGRCPGYVVDHVKALACGGLDSHQNMQWQTVAEAKAKDKWERKECGR